MHRIRQAASWIPRNFRYLPLAAAWPLVVYYAGTGILGIAGWAAILLAAGAWYAGADFLCKFAEREPASYVGRNLLWVPLRVLWPACAALFIVHVLTNAWPAFLSNLAAAAAAFALYGMSARAFTLPVERHHRGAERSDRAPTEASVRAYGNDPRAVWWGGILLPGKAVIEHTAFVGVTGSGKTLSIKLFLQQLLPQIRKGSDCRALIYDADQEMIPYLTALQRYRPSNAQHPILDPEVPIITLNPYDERGYAWDIAADVTTDATAIEVASLLFPGEVGDQDPFFTSAAQQVLRHIMMAFHYNNDDRWTFKELVDTFRTEAAMRCALESCPLTAVLYWFSVKRSLGRSSYVHPERGFVALVRSRGGTRGRRVATPTSVCAPGSALGSLPSVALSSVQAIVIIPRKRHGCNIVVRRL